MMAGQTAHPAEQLPLGDWKLLSSATERLEKAWQISAGDNEPSLREFLPDIPDPAVRQRVLMELVKTDLDLRWQRGRETRIEEYLGDWPELRTDVKCPRELLDTECLARATWDHLPTQEEIQRRFPEIGDSIDLEAIATQVDSENRPLHQVVPKLPQIPSQLGPYRILRRLGEGGMGEVYLAHDAALNREVAIKVPQLDLQRKPDATARFLREAKAAASIQHENVCAIYHVSTEHDQPFLVMERITGQSLEERLSQGPFSPNEAARIVTRLADALDKFHQKGLIHRDIKPSNVMLTSKGRPVLMDFGLAQEVEEKTGAAIPKSLRGTPAYIAPELLNSATSSADRRSDVYSLGVLLYHLLAGKPPFQGSLTKVLRSVAEEEPPPLKTFRPNVDPNLERICKWAMAKSPERRSQRAEDLAFALDLWSRASKRSAWLPWVTVACAAGFLLSLGALIWALRSMPETPLSSPQNPVAQSNNKTFKADFLSNPAHQVSKRQIAGAAVPNPEKSEPGGDFELAWVLPLNNENIGFFADKIDPENDSDMYLIEATRGGKLEIALQSEPDAELRIDLYDASQDRDADGQPDGLDGAEASRDYPYCRIRVEAEPGQRLYLQVRSRPPGSRGDYHIFVRPEGSGITPDQESTFPQDLHPGPPVDPAVMEELRNIFQEDQHLIYDDQQVNALRNQLVSLCQKHRGRDEVRRLGMWTECLSCPDQAVDNLHCWDLRQKEVEPNPTDEKKIPPNGTLAIYGRTRGNRQWQSHMIQGWKPGSIAIQLIPLDENTGGFCEVSVEGQSRSFFGKDDQPSYSTQHGIVRREPENTVRLRTQIRSGGEVSDGEYLLLLWQPEE